MIRSHSSATDPEDLLMQSDAYVRPRASGTNIGKPLHKIKCDFAAASGSLHCLVVSFRRSQPLGWCVIRNRSHFSASISKSSDDLRKSLIAANGPGCWLRKREVVSITPSCTRQ